MRTVSTSVLRSKSASTAVAARNEYWLGSARMRLSSEKKSPLPNVRITRSLSSRTSTCEGISLVTLYRCLCQKVLINELGP
jgi:hypothetical protein